MERPFFAKTSYPKPQKLPLPTNPTESSFKDDNIRDFKTEMKTESDFPPIFTAASYNHLLTEQLETRPELTERAATRASNFTASKQSRDELFTTLSNLQVKPMKQTKSLTRLKPNPNFRDLKSRMTPEYSISEFYLKTLAPNKNISEIPLGTKLSSSRISQPFSILENGGKSATPNDFKKSTSQSRQAIDELSKFADGRSIKMKFYESLPPQQKEFYFARKEFIRLFQDLDVALFCMDEVTQRTKCYRVELGVMLEKAGSCYRKIIERILDSCMKLDLERQTIFNKKMEENKSGLERFDLEKRAVEEKLRNYKVLMDIKDSEAKMYEFNMKSLENEINMLHELLKKDYLLEQKFDPTDAYKLRNELNQIQIAEPSQALNNSLIGLQDNIKNLEDASGKKEEILKEMNNLVKAMLKGGKKTQSTQVEDGDLAWAGHNLLHQKRRRVQPQEFNAQSISSINLDGPISREIIETGSLQGIDPARVAEYKEKHALQDEKKEADITPQPTSTKKPDKLETVVEVAQAIADNWNLPLSLIIFMENVTKAKENANILPWPFFKKLIFEIYIDKLHHNIEISNSLITTFMPMHEFLCIFFLKVISIFLKLILQKYKMRRTAEIKLMEFLVTLRYYIKHWQRAMSFANMCQISTLKIVPNAIHPTFIEEFDPYVQNFFLFAFSKVLVLTDHIHEYQDGLSYLEREKVDELTHEVLVFESESHNKKFLFNLTKHYRFFNDGTIDREGIDVDRLLQWYIEDFLEARSRIMHSIEKGFIKLQQTTDTLLSIEDVQQLLTDNVEQESPINGFMYPGLMTMARCFIFALTSGKNGYTITFEDLAKGIQRFGLTCPFPFINVSGQVSYVIPEQLMPLDEGSKQYKKGMLAGSQKKPKLSTTSSTKAQQAQLKTEVKKFDDDVTSNQSIREIKVPATENTESESKEVQQPQPQSLKKKEAELGKGAALKLDSSSALFAQHFGIIRELKNSCFQLKDGVRKETDPDSLKKIFEQILMVLEAGCQFLSFPVNM